MFDLNNDLNLTMIENTAEKMAKLSSKSKEYRILDLDLQRLKLERRLRQLTAQKERLLEE